MNKYPVSVWFILFLLQAIPAQSALEWLVVHGEWKNTDTNIQLIDSAIPKKPLGALNCFNSLLLTQKIRQPYSIDAVIQPLPGIGKNKGAPYYGIVFDLADGDNFLAAGLENRNKKGVFFVMYRAETRDPSNPSKKYNFKISEFFCQKLENAVWNSGCRIKIVESDGRLFLELPAYGMKKDFPATLGTNPSQISLIGKKCSVLFHSLKLETSESKFPSELCKKAVIKELILKQNR